MPTCPICEYEFERKWGSYGATKPAKSEEPFFAFDPDHRRTVYICSTVCMDRYLNKRDFSEPRGPDPPRY